MSIKMKRLSLLKSMEKIPPADKMEFSIVETPLIIESKAIDPVVELIVNEPVLKESIAPVKVKKSKKSKRKKKI